jgi:hypothetical protein
LLPLPPASSLLAMFELSRKKCIKLAQDFTEKLGMTYANLWTYECPIFAETEMNQHFGDNGQLCRSLHKNMSPYTPAQHHGTCTIVPHIHQLSTMAHAQEYDTIYTSSINSK